MFSIYWLCILFSVQNTLVKCIIPALNVQKLDHALIQRKRQDTLETCRIFNAENDKKESQAGSNQFLRKKILPPDIRNTPVKFRSKYRNKYFEKYNRYSKRVKRSLDTDKLVGNGNPTLDVEDVIRVESIVDKLYDDMNEGGKKVKYRKQDLNNLTTEKTVDMLIKSENETDRKLSQSGRRYSQYHPLEMFQPALLLGPLGAEPDNTPQIPEATSYIPWPKLWGHGIVPYFIDPKSYDTHLAEIITKAFDYFEKATCIRLQKLREKPRDRHSMEDVEWVYITNPSGIKQCVHSNEKKVNKGVQMVIFGYDCMSTGEIVHEVMHVLGFPHEHTRPDRDKYLTVMWDNIKKGYKKYFYLRPSDLLMSLNLPYDYNSVLHYPARAFSRNGQMTLVAENGIKLGQREALSETDIAKVSLIYGAECVNRNKQYLLTTCPSVVKASNAQATEVTQQEIEDYFKDRLWPFGIVNYKLRDPMEFSAEERENIKAVIAHIEKETCIEFRDLTEENEKAEDKDKVGENEDKDKEDENQDVQEDSDINSPPKASDIPETELWTTDRPNPETSDMPETETVLKTTDAPNKGSTKLDAGFTQPVKHISKPPKPPGVDTSSLETKELFNELTVKGIPDKDVIRDSSLERLPPGSFNKKLQLQENEIPDNAIEDDSLNYQVLTKELSARRKESDNSSTVVPNTTGPEKPEVKESRKKREAPNFPLSPHRRHANSILVLTRSSRSGCNCPPPGRVDGNKGLEINTDCFNSVNDLLHVFVHVLGLEHQHNSHDRDNYLHIFWPNMTEEVKTELMKKLPPAASVGFPYDYLSVTHYPWLEIKNGNINMMYPIWNDGWVMGHWQGLSSYDVQKINLLYAKQCAERKKHL